MSLTEQDLEKLSHSLDASIVDIDDLAHAVPSDTRETTIRQRVLARILAQAAQQRRQRRWIWSSAAAIAALLLCVGSLLLWYTGQPGEYREIATRYGEKYIVVLPDGSKVWLNAGSRLTYPTNFSRNRREVGIEGEAFFEVTKNPRKPFVVSTDKMTVEVLGTTFNISAYANDAAALVSLETGKVRLTLPNDRHFATTLAPGQTAIVSGKSCMIASSAERGNASGWKNDELEFRDTPMDEVLKTLERRYNVQFDLDAPQLHDYTYTFQSPQEDLHRILERMALITPIEFHVMANGRYKVTNRK